MWLEFNEKLSYVQEDKDENGESIIMDIIKHGRYFEAKEKPIACRVKCDNCGCVFDMERTDFPIFVMPDKVTWEEYRHYVKNGLCRLVACPECGNYQQVYVKLDNAEKNYLEYHAKYGKEN